MQIARETRAVTQSGALSMVRDHAVADVRTARNQNKAAPSVRDSVDSVSFGRKHSQIHKKNSHISVRAPTCRSFTLERLKTD